MNTGTKHSELTSASLIYTQTLLGGTEKPAGASYVYIRGLGRFGRWTQLRYKYIRDADPTWKP